jgi:hypothetical protein
MRYPTLEELAARDSTIDIAEYGLKVEGIVELIQERPNLVELGLEYTVPEGIPIPASAELSRADFDECYAHLVEGITAPAVFLARSSHKDEMPGRFDTIIVAYDPQKREESFDRMFDAVQTVRANPRKSVLMQRMDTDVEYTSHESIELFSVPLYDGDGFAAIDVGELQERLKTALEARGKESCVASIVNGDIRKSGSAAATTSSLRFLLESEQVHEQQWMDGYIRGAQTAEEKRDAKITFTVGGKPTRPVAGRSAVGFMARSHSHADPGDAIITACYGLPTKLVRDSSGFIAIPHNDEDGFKEPINIGKNYWDNRDGYDQATADVFDLDGSRVICSRGFSRHEEPLNPVIGEVCQRVPYGIKEHAQPLVDAVRYLSAKHGVPVEIEGMTTTMGSALSIFQLTRSRLLPNVLDRLSDVAPELLILRGEGVVGSAYLQGDIVLGARAHSDRAIVMLERFDDAAIDSAAAYVVAMDENDALNGKAPRGKYSVWSTQHFPAFLTEQVYRRSEKEKNGIAIMDGGLLEALAQMPLGAHEGRRSVIDGVPVLHDVVIEAARGEYQIYFN